MAVRGGGLVIGTDSSPYAEAGNFILKQIGVAPIVGYDSGPSNYQVDPASPFIAAPFTGTGIWHSHFSSGNTPFGWQAGLKKALYPITFNSKVRRLLFVSKLTCSRMLLEFRLPFADLGDGKLRSLLLLAVLTTPQPTYVPRLSLLYNKRSFSVDSTFHFSITPVLSLKLPKLTFCSLFLLQLALLILTQLLWPELLRLIPGL